MRGARRARRPGEYPSHRLPSFLRAALHWRHRPAGLQGSRPEGDDQVEGYHIYVGGGFGPDAALGREIYRDVKAEDAPQPSSACSRPIWLRSCLARRDVSRILAPRTRSKRLKQMFEAEAGE